MLSNYFLSKEKDRNMKKYTFVLVSISVFFLISLNACAQQEAGDKEFGFNGMAFFTHTSPVMGMVAAQGTIGKYFKASDYLGVNIGPGIEFGGGQKSGNLTYAGDYRHLFGGKNSKVYPFIGAEGGAITQFAGSSSGGTSTMGMIAPEVGLKIYASKKSAFEITYQMPIYLNGVGEGAGFGERSMSLIIFGFKHLFGK